MANSDNIAYLDAARAGREAASAADPLKSGDGGGTSGGMERVWEKLAEHDRRFDKIEGNLEKLGTDVHGLKSFVLTNTIVIVGAVAASTLALLGLVYAARQDTTSVMGAALSAIQTVIAARPSEPTASPQPTIIVVPTDRRDPPPTPPPAPKPPQ
jgi:hypothetical protein